MLTESDESMRDDASCILHPSFVFKLVDGDKVASGYISFLIRCREPCIFGNHAMVWTSRRRLSFCRSDEKCKQLISDFLHCPRGK
mmetsp:Transcript_18569/g.28666  ORF Transcript_18569/g.28666 Transcript_18569/m.28666 type:complete len:85 (-) Transcript_18569:35-289(-)